MIGRTYYEVVDDGEFRRWNVDDVVYTDAGWRTILVSGGERMAVETDAFEDAIDTEALDEGGRWRHHNPRARGPTESFTVTSDPELDRVVAPRQPSALEFQQESGRGSRSEVINPFLEGASDSLVHHDLGGVVGWKAAFTARYPKTDDIISAIVLSRPKARMLDDGSALEITRLANHPTRPPNTSSWMLAKARNWARHKGYDRIITYSGVADNAGVCYRAAGFELDDVSQAEGDGWKRQGDDRKVYQGGGSWERARWVDHLQESEA